jgi:hypothetical protein
MNAIKATYRNGQFVLDEPVNWPEGKRVVIAPADDPSIGGMTGDEQTDDPESIARWIKEFDAIPPPPCDATPSVDVPRRVPDVPHSVDEKPSVEERLLQLEQLFGKAIITKEEYKARRHQILQEV